jgi:hypothetical protein
MTDPSLNRRLDHHARRSGFAIGASMAVAIVLLIGAFVWLFALINPYLSDFIGAEAAPTEQPTVAAVQGGAGVTPTAAPAPPTATVAPAVTPTVAPTVAPSDDAAQPSDTGEFQADYQVGSDGGSINFRSEAGTDGSEILDTLEPGTPLQSTGEEETADGVVWLEFTTEDGATGWMREIDTEAI